MPGFQALMNYGLPVLMAGQQQFQQMGAMGANIALGRKTGQFLGQRAGMLMDRFQRESRDIRGFAGLRSAELGQQYGLGEEANLRQWQQGILPGYEGLAQGMPGRYEEMRDRLGRAWTARTERLTSELEGLGTQARKDIERRYGDVASAERQRLQSRGFGGSTVMGAVERGVEREKGAELASLEEGLRRERIGVIGQATGQELGAHMGMEQMALGARGQYGQMALGAAERGMGANERMMLNRMNLMTGLTGDQLAAHQSMLGMGMGYGTQLTGDIANFLGGVNIGYPSPNAMNIGQAVGAGSYPVPDYGGGNPLMGALGGAGAGAGLDLALTAGMFGMGAVNPALLGLTALGGGAAGYALTS